VYVRRWVEREVFAPSSASPEQAQPIIEREQIEIGSIVDSVLEEQPIAQVGRPAEIAAQAPSASGWCSEMMICQRLCVAMSPASSARKCPMERACEDK
jgi:hypothetical protein